MANISIVHVSLSTFPVFLFAIGLNLSNADLISSLVQPVVSVVSVVPADGLDVSVLLDLVHDAVDSTTMISNTLTCLMNSCDPLAIEKIMNVYESKENDFKLSPSSSNPDLEMAAKLFKATEEFVPLLTAIDPECSKDWTYTCPTGKLSTTIPIELEQLIDLLKTIEESADCATVTDIPTIIQVVANCVSSLTNSVDTSGTAIQRLLPAFRIIEDGMKSFCSQSNLSVE